MTMRINLSSITRYLLNSKPVKYLTNPNAAGAAVTIATISNLSKDAVNCAYYVHQSLNNERIPEDKRKFVAGIDLANGILNVTLQGLVSYALTKHVGKFFDKKVATRYFTEEKYKKLYSKLNNKIKYEDFVSLMEKNKGAAKVGLSVITALVAMQVVTKRILVPLIATPGASLFKNMFEKMEARKKEKESVEKTDD